MSARQTTIYGNIYMITFLPLKGGDTMSPIGKHRTWKHNKNPHCFRFFAPERIHNDIRGGDWDRLILQREARWIHQLGATQAPGPNVAVNFKPFLVMSNKEVIYAYTSIITMHGTTCICIFCTFFFVFFFFIICLYISMCWAG